MASDIGAAKSDVAQTTAPTEPKAPTVEDFDNVPDPDEDDLDDLDGKSLRISNGSAGSS